MLTESQLSNKHHYDGTIFHDGFKFHRKYIGKQTCCYWCASNRNKESLCTAKIKMCPQGKIEMLGKHDISCYEKQESSRIAMGFNDTLFEKENCIPDLTEKMLNRAGELAVENMSEQPKKILLQVLRETEKMHHIFKGASSCKIINRIKNARAKHNHNDVCRRIEMDYLAKMKNSNLNFSLQFNVTFPNEIADGKLERIIGFGNPSLFRVFGGNQKIFIDGIFKICPRPFDQCLIFMFFNEQTDAFVPVFYVLLTSKNLKVYRNALCLIKNAVSYKMQPLTITCNYEKALHHAIAEEFPNAIINGCLFHWKQAIRRKIRELGFEEPVIDRFMHRSVLETLTVIPPKDIETCGIPYVREIVDENLNENDMKKIEIFWQYFNKFWMSSPSFICRWNVHHQSLNHKRNLMRTNNGLEQYNRSLKDIFKNSTPSLISFVETFESESHVQAEKLKYIRKGLVINKKRKMETDIHPSEYNEPCLYYSEFVKNMESM